MDKDRVQYDEAVAEAQKLGIRYEYQPMDYLLRQIKEREQILKSGSNSAPRTYINPDVRGSVLEDDYESYKLTYEPYRDVDDMMIGDKVVVNPRIAPRCARIDLIKLRSIIANGNGILDLINVNHKLNTAEVGEMGGESIELPSVAVERLIDLEKPRTKRKVLTEEERYQPNKGLRDQKPVLKEDGAIDMASLGLTPEQELMLKDARLTKSDKIRKLLKDENVTIANIARAVNVHYSHAYSVIDAYRKLLKKKE